ncbi:hypothetical protein IMZ48_47605 [Candidatus Bathyarchaeota archaeon]|nr:hypothetical protein [Candidatus Bathyarchaeota archaeon]
MVAWWRDSDVGMRGVETGTREMSMSRWYFGKENAHKGRGNPAFRAYWATKKVVEREVGVCGEGDEVAAAACECVGRETWTRELI